MHIMTTRAKKTNRQLNCWDFTINKIEVEPTKLKKQLCEICKEGNFQKEKGIKSGKIHYQGRVSTKSRYRFSEIKKLASDTFLRGIHWSPTSNACKGNYEYVTKEFTRVEGPWDLLVHERYIPRQIRDITQLRPFQQSIVADAGVWDTRHINIVYDVRGLNGKTILKGYLRAHGIGRPIPPVTDYRDMMRMVMDLPTSKLYLVDMPKAFTKKLSGFYAAIETIKDGYAYDDRHRFREKVFDCPNIWIFTNTMPNWEFMSKDRWKVWEIEEHTFQLVKYTTQVSPHVAPEVAV